MTLLRFTVAVLMPLALAGCASGGPTGREILTSSIAPQKARVVIYRPSIMGLAVQPSYLVDGRAVAASQPQGFVVCELQPGPHEIGVENAPLNVNFGGGSDKSKVDLLAGQTHYFKADMQIGLTVGVLTLTQVTEQQGQADSAELTKVASNCT